MSAGFRPSVWHVCMALRRGSGSVHLDPEGGDPTQDHPGGEAPDQRGTYGQLVSDFRGQSNGDRMLW